MIEKKVTIDGRDWTFRSSALIPKLYRAKFGRDLVKDMRSLAAAYKEVTKEGMTEEEKSQAYMSVMDLEIFERVAWIMLKHAGENVGDDPDEWLIQLDGAFSVYAVLPEILALWNANNATTSVPRKK